MMGTASLISASLSVQQCVHDYQPVLPPPFLLLQVSAYCSDGSMLMPTYPPGNPQTFTGPFSGPPPKQTWTDFSQDGARAQCALCAALPTPCTQCTSQQPSHLSAWRWAQPASARPSCALLTHACSGDHNACGSTTQRPAPPPRTAPQYGCH